MGDSRDALHSEVDLLPITAPAAAVAIHALIDLGIVTSITCMHEECRRPGEPFSRDGGRRNPLAISLDHIQQQSQGGSHRPENIRIVHYVCNCASMLGVERPIVGLKNSFTVLLKRARALQLEIHGFDLGELEGDELAEYLRMNALALHTELSELLQELNWKPWKPGDPLEFDREKVVDEYVDIMFFWLNLAVALRITGPELVDAYLAKYEENELRAIQQVLKSFLPSGTREKLPRVNCAICGKDYPTNWIERHEVTCSTMR